MVDLSENAAPEVGGGTEYTFTVEPMSSRLRESLPHYAKNVERAPHWPLPQSEHSDVDLQALVQFSCGTAHNALQDNDLSSSDKHAISGALVDLVTFVPDLFELMEKIPVEEDKAYAFHCIRATVLGVQQITALRFRNETGDRDFKREKATANGIKTGRRARDKASLWRRPALDFAKRRRSENSKLAQKPLAEEIIGMAFKGAPIDIESIVPVIRQWERTGELSRSKLNRRGD